MARLIVPVILSGGSGTRLWPLSTRARPKQLLELVGEHSLLQNTVLRLQSLAVPVAAPIVVCNAEHGPLVAEQLRTLGVTASAIVLEPQGRNSAPAVTITALLARRLAPAGEEPLLLVLPADHVIADTAAFAAAVERAVAPASSGHLVVFGVTPTAPATGYGYIRRGEPHGEWAGVAEFVEKPDAATAAAYLASEQYLWNSGMFLFAAADWLVELETFAPAMLSACRAAMDAAETAGGFTRLDALFAACPADSIDYAVMEKTVRGAVVPLDAGWSDVGSWASLHDVLPKDSRGNTVVGDAILESCRNTYVVSNGRLIAVVGLDGVVVVETDDAVLVMSREHAEAVKTIAERVAKRSET